MTQNQTATALLILRVTLGIFLLQWGIEKFMVPDNTPAIWGHFYGIAVPASAATIFGYFRDRAGDLLVPRHFPDPCLSRRGDPAWRDGRGSVEGR